MAIDDISILDVGRWFLKASGDTSRYNYTYIENFFTKEQCEELCTNVEDNHELEKAQTLDASKTDERRDCQISSIRFDGVFQSYYETLTSIVNQHNSEFWRFNLTCIECLQYTVYDSSVSKQSRYDWHTDDGFTQSWCNEIRKLSFVMLLSDPKDFTGGELQIKTDLEDSILDMEQGTIVFFPSPTLHRVTPVTKGIRKTLVGWVRGPNWT